MKEDEFWWVGPGMRLNNKSSNKINIYKKSYLTSVIEFGIVGFFPSWIVGK